MPIVKPKIIVICGPTASGKSAAAIRLAQEFDGEIISADSRQVYRGLDLGSGKVIKQQPVDNEQQEVAEYISEGIVHHLIDVANPEEDFNVSHFKKAAGLAIKKILKRNKLPIICGGSGFWINALVNDTFLPAVKPNPELRKRLEKETAAKLFAKLQKLDPERAKNIDAKNKVRLVRALEICAAFGSVPKQHKKRPVKYDFLQIGIATERIKLNAKIKKRLEERFNEGMLTEVENLLKNGTSPAWLEKIGLEYRWLTRHLQKKIMREEMENRLYLDIIHYAKRQMTWLKRNNIVWCENFTEIKKTAKEFLH